MAGYDAWKAREPDPHEFDYPPSEDPPLAQCDCCAEMVPEDEIATVWAYGIETHACMRCRGGDPREAREVERQDRYLRCEDT